VTQKNREETLTGEKNMEVLGVTTLTKIVSGGNYPETAYGQPQQGNNASTGEKNQKKITWEGVSSTAVPKLRQL